MEFIKSRLPSVVFTYPFVKVFALFLVWCSLGLCLEIPGPTMIDIKLLFTASYEDVSRSVSGRGAGGFVGALVGGILVDKFSHSLDLFIAVSETLAAVAILLVPFSFSVNTLWFHYFTLGLCGSVISIAGIRSAMSLWPQKTTMTLQLLHTGYGIGSLLVPVLVNPFLAVLKHTQPAKGKQAIDHENFTVIKDTNVQYAFVSIGIGTAILSLVFYYFHFTHPSRGSYKRVQTDSISTTSGRSCRKMMNPGTYANGQTTYGFIVILLLFVFFFSMVGAEELFGHFVRSFSVDAFNFSKTQASYINMIFWLGLTIGRLVGAFMSSYMSIKKLFALQVFVHAISVSILNLYVTSTPMLLWLCSATEGFTIAPLYAGGIAYGNTLIELTGVSLMVIQFAGSFGDLSFIWVAGRLYDVYGPKAVLYALQFVGLILCVCVTLFRIAARFRVEKHTVDVTV